MTEFRHIAVTTDFSERSRIAFAHAASLARRYDAKVTCVYCLPPPEPVVVGLGATAPLRPDDLLDQLDERLRAFVGDAFEGIETSTRVVEGYPDTTIPDLVREAGVDLVVVATHGRTGLSHVLLGSVCERIMRHAGCPVLAVPARDSA